MEVLALQIEALEPDLLLQSVYIYIYEEVKVVRQTVSPIESSSFLLLSRMNTDMQFVSFLELLCLTVCVNVLFRTVL